ILLGRALPQSLALLDAEAWRGLDVSLRCGARATSIDRAARRVRLADGDEIEYDTLVLATGSRPRAFPGRVQPGAELLELRTLDDAERLRRRLVPGRHLAIIGAGFIGMELAASARELAVEVTLIEAESRPLARLLPGAFAERLVAMHRARGVKVHLDARVASIEPHRVLLAG